MNPGNVLIKVHPKESNIILPNQENLDKPYIDYAEVVAVSEDITDLKKGDVIMEFKTVMGFEWETGQYAVVHRLAINMAITKLNFSKGKAKPTPNITA